MMDVAMIESAAGLLLIAAMIVRVVPWRQREEQKGRSGTGISQTNGRKELQADLALAFTNRAGTMAVLADGIGRENTGRLCAQLAADTILDRYEPCHVLNNPSYFFKSTFAEANRRIQMTIGERRGGASLAAVFTDSPAKKCQ